MFIFIVFAYLFETAKESSAKVCFHAKTAGFAQVSHCVAGLFSGEGSTFPEGGWALNHGRHANPGESGNFLWVQFTGKVTSRSRSRTKSTIPLMDHPHVS
jgi:hypothetical protein